MILAALGAVGALVLMAGPAPARPASSTLHPWSRIVTMQTDLLALGASYPRAITGLGLDQRGRVVVRLRSGDRVVYDDGRPKFFWQKLDRPDLQDALAIVYPLGPIRRPPGPGRDPGRFRVAALFRAVYGGSPRAVRANLVWVDFAGQRVRFNARAGAARALARVGRELAELLRRRPDLRKYVFPLGGTYVRRRIAGTRRLSPHAWGMAIDLNARHGAYWRWTGARPGRGPDPRPRYPGEIVRIFERHGFIWGGKWRHFDLAHFEYRPELLLKARFLTGR
ncbi:MAG: M15 family metallopeptidase [Proteobacteria bacterium]|nr:M15 family metallopeptidase [Pseudomonadota bacterium]MBU1742942.1 M15 family metallopeptidase [Pseudomonadota bacterium]